MMLLKLVIKIKTSRLKFKGNVNRSGSGKIENNLTILDASLSKFVFLFRIPVYLSKFTYALSSASAIIQ